MRDTSAKLRGAGKFFVQVYRIAVGFDAGKKNDIGFRASCRHMADRMALGEIRHLQKRRCGVGRLY